MTDRLCSRGSRADVCCQPGAWDVYAAYPYASTEPLDSRIIELATAQGLDPHAVDELVEGEWGWEPHDQGYEDTVRAAVEQLAGGGK